MGEQRNSGNQARLRPINMKVPQMVRERIERHAQESGRSLTQEVTQTLLAAYAADDARELIEARALVRELVEALESVTTWLDKWGGHVGSCAEGDMCTCGLAAMQAEGFSALTRAREAGYGEKQAEPSSPPTQSAE